MLKSLILSTLLLISAKQVEFVVDKGSDPIPQKLKELIIDRTTQACRDEGRPGVKKIIVIYQAKTGLVGVSYLCNEKGIDI